MGAIDLPLAAHGYLWCPAHARLRWIPGLDAIARDTTSAGVRVEWGSSWAREQARAYPWCRLIVLSVALFEMDNETLRVAWRHELAHCVGGRSHHIACHIALTRYN